jgi:hypothetical protein
VSAKIATWPNGLGFDVGPNEVWRWRKGETMVRLFRAEDPAPYFSCRLPGAVEPVEAVIEAFRRLAARTAADLNQISTEAA